MLAANKVALHIIITKIASTVTWIFNNIIVPVWDHFVRPIIQLASQGISFTIEKVQSLYSIVHRVIIAPTIEGIQKMAASVEENIDSLIRKDILFFS